MVAHLGKNILNSTWTLLAQVVSFSSVIKHYSKLIFMLVSLFAGLHFPSSNTLTTIQWIEEQALVKMDQSGVVYKS